MLRGKYIVVLPSGHYLAMAGFGGWTEVQGLPYAHRFVTRWGAESAARWYFDNALVHTQVQTLNQGPDRQGFTAV